MALPGSKAFSRSTDDVSVEGSSEDIARYTELDAAIWSMLSDHLQEKIIARLQFKFLFQTASLSKTWKQNLRSGPFQSEVVHGAAGSAASWESYAPVFVNNKRELVGYENNSERWSRLPTLWHDKDSVSTILDWRFRDGKGCLLCWTREYPHSRSSGNGHFPVLVTNPLTRSWKLLPRRPDMRAPSSLHVVLEGREAFKLVLGRLHCPSSEGSVILLQIFDSADSSWTTESHDTRKHGLCWAPNGNAVKNGVLHMIFYNARGRRPEYALVSFDLKTKIWKEIPQLYQEFDATQKPHQLLTLSNVLFSKLFVCGPNAMLVIFHQVSTYECGRENTDDTLSVFKLHVERGLVLEVSRAPTSMVMKPFNGACHGDCIYLGGTYPSCHSVVYNVATQTWHQLNSSAGMLQQVSGCDVDHMANDPCLWRMTSFTYQPGLNPFLEV